MTEIKIKKDVIWPVLLIFILLITLIINLRVTMTTNLIFGDEGFYASRGEWIAENLIYPKYYYIQSKSEAFELLFTSPPMFFFLVAVCFKLGGELLVKVLMPSLNILVALVLFFLVKKLYSTKAGFFAVIFLVVIPSFITYSVLLYPEVLAILFLTTSIFFLFRGLNEKRNLYLGLAGILGGLAAITEIGSMLAPALFLLIFTIYRKGFFKNSLITIGIFLVMITPTYIIHNLIYVGNPGIPGLPWSFPRMEMLKEIPEVDAGHLRSPVEEGRGTGATIMAMGILNYIQFAYSVPILGISLIGLVYLFLKRKKREMLVLAWFFLFLIMSFYFTKGGRAEDAARAMLYITPPLALFAGIALCKTYNDIKDNASSIAPLLVLVLVLWSLTAANTKAQSLAPIKVFSTSFFQGCDWIRENTPEGSLLLTLWQHRAEYACKHDTVYAGAPGGTMMILGGDQGYDIMKLHGVDYIYINKFSIRPGRELESFPLEFVRYVDRSDNFELVYETTPGCLTSNIQDCSLVYKVL
jgi:4-amino-4-deoxy-L-arabinose transferase-like glycosyltransferase